MRKLSEDKFTALACTSSSRAEKLHDDGQKINFDKTKIKKDTWLGMTREILTEALIWCPLLVFITSTY